MQGTGWLECVWGGEVSPLGWGGVKTAGRPRTAEPAIMGQGGERVRNQLPGVAVGVQACALSGSTGTGLDASNGHPACHACLQLRRYTLHPIPCTLETRISNPTTLHLSPLPYGVQAPCTACPWGTHKQPYHPGGAHRQVRQPTLPLCSHPLRASAHQQH